MEIQWQSGFYFIRPLAMNHSTSSGEENVHDFEDPDLSVRFRDLSLPATSGHSRPAASKL